MLISVTVSGNGAVIKRFHDIEGEGDIEIAVREAIRLYRESNPDKSLFDATISIDRA